MYTNFVFIYKWISGVFHAAIISDRVNLFRLLIGICVDGKYFIKTCIGHSDFLLGI
eukprot:TRINITY_DN3034_c0_g1_i1.p1 TRINITY_DN3034_c0_g1~~TRINITY_DN3034_c0_g1_i1.p1  ORF type:complete len:56 (+),score=3.36 TRINITY_DN3034_c0_g1_i1:167-334(+)